MHEVVLGGCRPEPLATYLKALGVLRLVAEQGDPRAKGRWDGDRFVLASSLDEASLVAFLAETYRPSPVLAAWNGGGGLFMRKGSKDPVTKAIRYDKPTSMTRATDALADAASERLAPYRSFIRLCREEIECLGLQTAPKGDVKHALLSRLRDRASDGALEWLDAAVLIGDDGNRYPPLLGTGGCDGNLDFANNLQQRIADVMDLATGEPTLESEGWLRASLFGEARPGMTRNAVGQFDPGRAGAANAGEGFSGNSLVDPWDFILFMEGALVLAGAATKRLEAGTPGALSYPFTVRATGAGSASSSDADVEPARDEIWLPVWKHAASFGEIRSLFSEGRITVGRRAARDAVDVARALGTLGVDRGIEYFVRYAFLKRNGLSYFATPLGRWSVSRRPQLELLDDRVDRWLDRVRRAARGKNATATLKAAHNRINRAIMDLARSPGPERVQEVLIAFAGAEALAARSPSLREVIPPVPRLSYRWAKEAWDHTPELRLARSLTEVGIRRRIVPVQRRSGDRWASQHDPGVVWARGPLVETLLKVLRRQEAELGMLGVGDPVVHHGARLDDIDRFLRGAVDDHRILELTEALALVTPPDAPVPHDKRRALESTAMPIWALSALAWDQRRPSEAEGARAPRSVVGLIAAGSRGDPRALTRIAARELRSGVLGHRLRTADERGDQRELAGLAVGPQHATSALTRRVVAALAFPLSDDTLEALAQQVFHLVPEPSNTTMESQ